MNRKVNGMPNAVKIMKNNFPVMVFGVKSCEPVRMEEKEGMRRSRSKDLTDRGQRGTDKHGRLRQCPRRRDVGG